jgi:eukaryotic-like serine/threonine-protein kinase
VRYFAPESVDPSIGTAASDLTGKTLGRFRVEAKIGEGGMGVVYRAVDTGLGRSVALKVLAARHVSDPDRRRRLLREARVAAAVDHPNVAGVYDVGEADGQVFIAMELVVGESLRACLSGRPLPLEDAVRLALGIARGVAKAHDRGIVHRDLKPENIFVTETREVKLLDFGLAKLHESEGSLVYEEETRSNATLQGKVAGTPGYMAPEQVTGKEVSFRADVFTFGVIFYEMVTGELPFRGESTMDVLIASTRDDPHPASALSSAVTPAIERLLARCLAKRPAARFANGGELVRELEALEAAPGGRETAARIDAPPAPVAPAHLSRRRWRSLGVVALVVAATISAGVFSASRARTNVSAPPSPFVTAPSRASGATTLLDFPPPQSDSPEALAAFAEGVRALHDSGWELARRAFARSVAADPSLAAGHLRVAMTSSLTVGTVTQTRIAFQQATQLRSRLSERDQVLLNALEPTLQRSPPDMLEGAARLRKATELYPNDAELHLWVGLDSVADPATALVSYTRATELDPQYPDAWESRGRSLAWLGRVDEARGSLARCLEIPTALDCVFWLKYIDAADGRCEACEKDARLRIDRDPLGLVGYRDLADTFLALGRPNEAVQAALTQSWTHWADPYDRAREQLVNQADAAVVQGDFAQARSFAQRELDLVESDPEGSRHFQPTQTLVQIALETGDEKLAGKLADAFARRAAAWTTAEGGFDKDAMPWLLHVASRQRLLSAPAFEAARSAWTQKWVASGRVIPGYVWVMAYAETAETAADAEAALAMLDELGPVPAFFPTFGNSELHVGRVYALAGRPAEAEPHLLRAARHCGRFADPFAHPRAELALGGVRESMGDGAGACDAYRSVVAQWGNAKPRSVTAERARERLHALSCTK